VRCDIRTDVLESFPVAFWLVPALPYHRELATIIEGLADELNAPRFEPHVTVYAGARGADDDVEALLIQAAQRVAALDLRIAAVGTSPELFKTLYLELEPDPQTAGLCQGFRAGLRPAVDYVLKPHLSLLYKRLPAATRTALAGRFDMVGQHITFDQIAAVRPGHGRHEWFEIVAWDVWLRKPLGSQIPR
jgi:Cyclic phosphodiesterase-like protein